MKKTQEDEFLDNPFFLAELFYEKRKIFNYQKISKVYPGKRQIKLSNRTIPNQNLGKIILSRVSARNYINKTLSQESLGTILYFGAQHRSYPSAGGKYALEIYLISINSSLPKGIYYYDVKSHSLREISILKNFDISLYIPQKDFKKTSCFIVITGILAKTTQKYGGRGYRYVFMEAGHIVQNFYLLVQVLNLGGCAIGGGFYENRLNRLLKIDGKEESIVYIFALGHVKNH